jgi:hypothetical protein
MIHSKLVRASKYVQELPHRLRPIAYLEIFVLCFFLAMQFKYAAIARVKRHFKLSRINEADLKFEECDVPLEVLIVSSHKDLEVLPFTVESILDKCVNPIDRVTLIVPKKALNSALKILESSTHSTVTFCVLDEETLISQDFRIHLKERYGDRYGWVLQQVLKLNYALSCDRRGLLVVDADTILLKKMGFLQGDGLQTLLVSSELHKIYFDKLKLLGFSPVEPWMSTVTHHMLFQPSLLKTALNEINSKSAEDIIRAIESRDLNPKDNLSPFSIDYELYGQWLISNKRDKISLKLTQNIELKRDMKSFELVRNLLSTDHSNPRYASASLHSYL